MINLTYVKIYLSISLLWATYRGIAASNRYNEHPMKHLIVPLLFFVNMLFMPVMVIDFIFSLKEDIN